jgi:hypothetical protein
MNVDGRRLPLWGAIPETEAKSEFRNDLTVDIPPVLAAQQEIANGSFAHFDFVLERLAPRIGSQEPARELRVDLGDPLKKVEDSSRTLI